MNLEGLTFDDVLLKPKLGVLDSRTDADISVSSLNLQIPIIASPMPSVASVPLLKEMHRLGGVGVVHRINRSRGWRDMVDDDRQVMGNTWVAVGIDDLLFDDLYVNGFRIFVLDVAYGHSRKALEFVANMKENYPDAFIVGGSVATREGAEDMLEYGADALRVGIGPGSVCTTRQVTGFGVPQLQAIQECAENVYDYTTDKKYPVIADGGIRNSGDIVKALAAGADAVMIGGLFANTVEAGATGYHWGNASHKVNGHHAPEGIEIQFTSPPERLEDVVKRLTWGLRSAISYAGGNQLSDLRSVQWTRLTDAGRRESKLV